MDNILLLLIRITMLILGAVNLAMLIRAITSWMPGLDGAWLDMVYMLTEPVVAPVRGFFELFPVFRNSPIDFSFLISFMLLNIVQELLTGFASMVIR